MEERIVPWSSLLHWVRLHYKVPPLQHGMGLGKTSSENKMFNKTEQKRPKTDSFCESSIIWPRNQSNVCWQWHVWDTVRREAKINVQLLLQHLNELNAKLRDLPPTNQTCNKPVCRLRKVVAENRETFYILQQKLYTLRVSQAQRKLVLSS